MLNSLDEHNKSEQNTKEIEGLCGSMDVMNNLAYALSVCEGHSEEI